MVLELRIHDMWHNECHVTYITFRPQVPTLKNLTIVRGCLCLCIC